MEKKSTATLDWNSVPVVKHSPGDFPKPINRYLRDWIDYYETRIADGDNPEIALACLRVALKNALDQTRTGNKPNAVES